MAGSRFGRSASKLARSGLKPSRHFAPFSDSGRHWPGFAAFEGTLRVNGYSVEGFADMDGVTEIPLPALFQHVPAAVLKARFTGSARPATKRSKQFA